MDLWDLWPQSYILLMELWRPKLPTEPLPDIIVSIRREEKPLLTPLPASSLGLEASYTELSLITTLILPSSATLWSKRLSNACRTERWQKTWQSVCMELTVCQDQLIWTPWTSSRPSIRDWLRSWNNDMFIDVLNLLKCWKIFLLASHKNIEGKHRTFI